MTWMIPAPAIDRWRAFMQADEVSETQYWRTLANEYSRPPADELIARQMRQLLRDPAPYISANEAIAWVTRDAWIDGNELLEAATPFLDLFGYETHVRTRCDVSDGYVADRIDVLHLLRALLIYVTTEPLGDLTWTQSARLHVPGPGLNCQEAVIHAFRISRPDPMGQVRILERSIHAHQCHRLNDADELQSAADDFITWHASAGLGHFFTRQEKSA